MLENLLQQVLSATSSEQYEQVSLQIQTVIQTDQFPEQCVSIIILNKSDELTLLAQTQLKNWLKQSLHPKGKDFKEQILQTVAKILLESKSQQQFLINYESFCLCLDNIPLIESMQYINQLLLSLTTDQLMPICFIVQASCRRNRNSIKARDLFKQLFADQLYPIIKQILDNFTQVPLFVLKSILDAYTQSLQAILPEHLSNFNYITQKLNEIYLSNPSYQQNVLEILLQYFIAYKKIQNYDPETKLKYQTFSQNYQSSMLPQIQFVLKQLENYSNLTPNSIGQLVKILRFSFECKVEIPQDLQLQLFNFILFLINQQYTELVAFNTIEQPIFSLPIDHLHQLAQSFDSQIFTPLNSEYFYAAPNSSISVVSLIDELARFLGVYFNSQEPAKMNQILIDLYSNLASQTEENFYSQTIAIAQICRRMALNNINNESGYVSTTLEIINFYRQFIGENTQKSWISLWLINTVINDLNKTENYIQLTSQLTNQVLLNLQSCTSLGQFFLSLVFAKQRLNSLSANYAAYNTQHFLNENIFQILSNLLIHVTNSFPFYTEIYDSLVTTTELLIHTHPEFISGHFSTLFHSLAGSQIDQICDLLELFCTVFIIREAEIDVETYHLVTNSILNLLQFLLENFKIEQLQNLETAGNAICALCSNVETGELREEIQPKFAQILAVLLEITVKNGDWVVNYTVSGIMSICDVFAVWEVSVWPIFQQFSIPISFHCLRFCSIFCAAHAFGNVDQACLAWAHENLLKQVDLALCDVRIEFFAVAAVYLLMRLGYGEFARFGSVLAVIVSKRYDFVNSFFVFAGGDVQRVSELRSENQVEQARQLAQKVSGGAQIEELYGILESQGLVKMREVLNDDGVVEVDELQGRIERIMLLSQEIIKWCQ